MLARSLTKQCMHVWPGPKRRSPSRRCFALSGLMSATKRRPTDRPTRYDRRRNRNKSLFEKPGDLGIVAMGASKHDDPRHATSIATGTWAFFLSATNFLQKNLRQKILVYASVSVEMETRANGGKKAPSDFHCLQMNAPEKKPRRGKPKPQSQAPRPRVFHSALLPTSGIPVPSASANANTTASNHRRIVDTAAYLTQLPIVLTSQTLRSSGHLPPIPATYLHSAACWEKSNPVTWLSTIVYEIILAKQVLTKVSAVPKPNAEPFIYRARLREPCRMRTLSSI
ncbi:hypothetical protein B0T17DRAFT_502302 [Bombardia bombarda]|uniref:Uncharacterized protein n=1 Tax=Bombardia bombarda TaxID=252184 RepID=A0AA39XJY9_9PEZI|nr:hypothetical protein B0T17DRAFT_502302 [Bombardia bombarda]